MSDKPKYDNNNQGALFKNDDKETDNHPDYKGTIQVNGADYWISAWLKTSAKGVKYMSLSVTPKERKDVSSTVPATQGRQQASNAPRTQQRAPQANPGHAGRMPPDNFDDFEDSGVPF